MKATQWNRLVLAGMILLPWLALADGGDDSLNQLDALVGRWMALRTTIAEEKREWKARREQWEEEIALLEQEAATLKKEINEGDTFASSVEQKRAEALARKEQMDVELRNLGAVLDWRRWEWRPIRLKYGHRPFRMPRPFVARSSR